jgi:ferredoxin
LKKSKGLIFISLCFLFVWFALFFAGHPQEIIFDPDFTIKQLAKQNGIKPEKLRRKLDITGLDEEASFQELQVDETKAHEAVSLVRGDFSTRTMAVVQMCFALLICLAIYLLSRNKMSLVWKISLLMIVITGFGFDYGLSFNPITGLIKVFKGIAGLEGNLPARLLVLIIFALMAVVGRKAICGWVCPYGAFQELIFKLPVLKAFKRKNKIPFLITNTVRFCLFALFVDVLFFKMFDFKALGPLVYPFVKLFSHIEFNLYSVIVVCIAVIITISILYYRPLCYFFCPFGLFSWFLEKISIFRISILKDKCIECGACVKACPGLAMKGLFEEAKFPADCFSCGECLNTCKFDALEYTYKT